MSVSDNCSQTHSSGFQECFIFIQQCAGLVGETTRDKAIYTLRGMLQCISFDISSVQESILFQLRANTVYGYKLNMLVTFFAVNWCVSKWKTFYKDTDGIMKALLQVNIP